MGPVLHIQQTNDTRLHSTLDLLKLTGEMNVLIVDDERSARRAMIRIVQRLDRVEIFSAADLEQARRVLDRQPIQVALIDLRLGPDARNRDGLTLVEEVHTRWHATPIVVSGGGAMADVRAAMRLGAHDYILKDELSEAVVLPILGSLLGRRSPEREVASGQSGRDVCAMAKLVGTSPAMARLRSWIQRAATSDRPVLVTGPTGAGKELVVGAIHAIGAPPTQPLLDLNCGAFPAALVEALLFGHERGAFTGADRCHEGYFTAVGEGTLFLDEIAELPLDLQAKLLRVLETRTFRPVGSSQSRRFTGRVVAATHANLAERVDRGSFREDLYYRINVLEITVPPLGERVEDIPTLVAHFATGQPRPLRFTAEAMDFLCAQPWPGNVRQLRNFIDRLAVFATSDDITVDEVRLLVPGRKPPVADDMTQLARAVLRTSHAEKMQLFEDVLINEALALSDGNKTAAARLLGVHRKVVERRVERAKVQGAAPQTLRSGLGDL
jgi:DNA-binding NtrC family response regulator